MPKTADALVFPGESLVLNPAKTDLTGPAKTILTNPTFLPQKVGAATAAGGVAEGSMTAAVAEGAGFFPILSSAFLAFGAGAGVGSYICNAVLNLEGCWGFSADSADPVEVGSLTWVFFRNPTKAGPGGHEIDLPGYTWVYGDSTLGIYYGAWNQTSTTCLNSSVSTASVITDTGATSTCETGEKEVRALRVAQRHAMSNRDLVGMTKGEAAGSGFTNKTGTKLYCPSESPTTCVASPSSDWSERFAKGLQNGSSGASAGTRANLGQAIAHGIAPTEVSDPYALTVTIPDCDGLTWGACKSLLEGVDLVPELDRLTWSTADLDIPPDTVVELSPDSGNELEKGKTVVVTVNPEEGDMPLVLPMPEPGETYSHYAARLSPGLSPSRVDVGEAFVDPSLGPNAVVRTVPEPGTRFDPSTSHDIDVQTNPGDAPIPSAAWVPPGIPAIDMSPLSGIPSPCSVFPFGLFCWVGEALAQFNTAGVCPGFSAPVADTGSDFDVSLCGETADTILGYLRPALLLAFIVGCGFMFARGTKAIGDD